MALVAPEILEPIIRKPDVPAGFDIAFRVKDSAEINAGSNTAVVELDTKSLDAARARNEGGSNKPIAEMISAKPTIGSAMTFAENQQSKADTGYQKLFTKRGMGSLADQSVSPMPQGMARRRDHRNVLSNINALSKNPLMRMRVRTMLQLRKTFDQIAAHKKKAVPINPEALPQTAKEKIFETAVANGQKNTPFGHIPSPLAAAKATGKLVGEFEKWANVGALIGGYVNLTPRLIRR